MKLFLWLLLIFSSICVAQSPLDFFPHHQGDIWEYWYPNGDSLQYRITSDTLGTDGKYYLTMTTIGNMIVDTSNNTVYRVNAGIPPSRYELRYKLDADSGDYWIVYQDTIAIFTAMIRDILQAYVFGTPTIIKRIDYYGRGINDWDSLLFETDYLASRFGLVAQDFDAFATLSIKGILMNGVRYGRVTSVEERKPLILPSETSLYQNYPNPFNPITRIDYALPEMATVTLRVYDVLGREVVTLVNEIQEPGFKSVSWDASVLPSGVYIYRLQAGSFSDMKKMLLMR